MDQFEVMPFDSTKESISHFQEGQRVAVTTSEQLGIEKTVAFSEYLSQHGFNPTPHIAARYVSDREHLQEILERLQNCGVSNIFVPAGDREEPVGEFDSSYQLLDCMRNELQMSFENVGVTGYPEGHHFLSDTTIRDALQKKQEYATYVVTQICFDSHAIQEWIQSIREQGVTLDVLVGVPGVVKFERLISMSQKVGVGESLKFARKTTGIIDFLQKILRSRGRYKPTDLVSSVRSSCDGFHYYTFNEVEATLNWYTQMK